VLEIRSYANFDGSGTQFVYLEQDLSLSTPFVWLRITNSGGDLLFDYSTDRLNWIRAADLSAITIFTGDPTVVGWGITAFDDNPNDTYSDLVSWEGALAPASFSLSSFSSRIGPGTPSRAIRITTLASLSGTCTYTLDDGSLGGYFYPASVSLPAGLAGQYVEFVYMALPTQTAPVTITVTPSGGGSTLPGSLILPIGVASNYAQDSFSGTSGTALLGHTPNTGAAWVEPYHPGAVDLTLDGSGGVYCAATGVFTQVRSITVNPNGTTISNFPMMFKGTYSYLADPAHGGYVQSPDGFDIIFAADSAGATLYNWEIQSYDPTTGDILAWVEVPSIINTSGALLYILYGNAGISTFQSPGSPWIAGFLGVYHLTESNTPYQDSTTNNNDLATVSILRPTLTTGLFGAAQQFSLSNLNFIEGNNPVTSNAVTVGFSCWIKTSATGTTLGIADNGAGASHGTQLYVDSTSGYQAVVLDFSTPAGVGNGSAVNDGNWHYVVGYNGGGGTLELSVDGGTFHTYSYLGSSRNSVAGLLLGALRGSGGGGEQKYFDGLIEEFRVFNSYDNNFSVNEYSNQSNPSSYYTIGSPSTSLNYAQYEIPTAAPQIDNDVAVTYHTVDTTKMVPTVGMFGSNLTTQLTGYTMFCEPTGITIGHYGLGFLYTFAGPTGGAASGTIHMRIAVRMINGSQFIFFIFNGVLFSGTPWLDNTYTGGYACIQPAFNLTPSSTDTVMVEFHAENADWT
jgi:hypothetical protein